MILNSKKKATQSGRVVVKADSLPLMLLMCIYNKMRATHIIFNVRENFIRATIKKGVVFVYCFVINII